MFLSWSHPNYTACTHEGNMGWTALLAAIIDPTAAESNGLAAVGEG
jgi:hypothetical protein